MIIYLSGPISLGGTSPPAEQERFKQVFYEYESALQRKGHVVLNPCRVLEQESWESYMKVHIPTVCRADAVVTLPRFTESRGSVLEVFIASQLKIPVWSIDMVPEIHRV